jgi:FixJ family two-component response regulator
MTSLASDTVFIVDDDEGVRDAIGELLNSVGLRTQCYGTAEEFLCSKRPDGPSCLVLDVRLPGISGLDFHVSWVRPA